MSNHNEINAYDDDANITLNSQEALGNIEKEQSKLSQETVKKRREIDDLLEKRRLEKELRDSFDDLDDDFYDEFEDD